MLVIGNRGITLVVGVIMAATVLIAFSSLVSGNDKVIVTLLGVFLAVGTAQLLKERLRRQAVPREHSVEDRDETDSAE